MVQQPTKGVGAGIYRVTRRLKIALSNVQNATVVHAEGAFINHSAEELLRQKATNQTIAIFSESQRAMTALSFYQVSPQLVGSCLSAHTIKTWVQAESQEW